MKRGKKIDWESQIPYAIDKDEVEELIRREAAGHGLKVMEGTMVTVLGTSLQNRDILRFFNESTWNVIGLALLVNVVSVAMLSLPTSTVAPVSSLRSSARVTLGEFPSERYISTTRPLSA